MSTTRSPRSVPTSRPGPWRKRSSTCRNTPAGILIRSSWKSWRGTEKKSYLSASGLPTAWRSDRGPGRMALTSILAGVRARFRGRPDTEQQQAILRLLVGVVLFVYLVPLAFGGREVNLLLVAAMVCYLTLCVTVFGWIYLSPAPLPARRVFAAV